MIYGLAFLLATLPFFPELSHPASRFFHGSVAILVFVPLCSQLRRPWRELARLPLFLPLVALLLVCLVYTLHSIYPYKSQEKLVRLILATMIYLTVGLAVGRERDIRIVLWSVFSGGTLLALNALWEQWTGYEDVLNQVRNSPIYSPEIQRELVRALESGRALARFGNPNHLAGYLLLSGWSSVLLWAVTERMRERGLVVAGGLAQAVCIYRTYSRSGLLVLLFSVLVGAAWMLRRVDRPLRRRLLFWAGVGSVILALALVIFAGKALGGRLFVTSTIVARIHFFQQALRLIKENFPDGTGLESFRYLATQHIRPGELESLYPHNIFLSAAVESGFLGVMVVAWLAAAGLRMKRIRTGAAGIVGWAVFGVFVLLSSVDFHNEIAELLFLFMALQGLCDGMSIPARRYQVCGLVRVVLGLVLGGIVWWYLVLSPYMAAFYQQCGLDAAAAGEPSVHLFEKAADWAPRDAEIMNNLGRALRRAGPDRERQLGLSYLRYATELNPFQAYLHGDLAEALFEDGLTQEAITVNEVARKLFPNKVLYIRRKAKYLLAMGRRKGWERWTAAADELEKENQALRP